jgi:hypothetical protein
MNLKNRLFKRKPVKGFEEIKEIKGVLFNFLIFLNFLVHLMPFIDFVFGLCS